MSDRQIQVMLMYDHPDVRSGVRYVQSLDLDAIGVVLQVMDALADQTDPNEIRRLAERAAEAVSG